MLKKLIVIGSAALSLTAFAEGRKEIEHYIEEVYRLPPVTTESPSIKAEAIIPPGLLYDTMWPDVYHGRLFIGDDGGHFGYGAGQLLSFDFDGNDLQIEQEQGRVPLYIDSTFAPDDFGRWANKLLITSQPAPEFEGALNSHFIFALDRGQQLGGEILCVWPTTEFGTSHLATELLVGPEGTPFDNFIYGGASGNRSIVKVDDQGNCTPWAEDLPGFPLGMGWSDDGKYMLVGLKVATANFTNVEGEGGVSTIIKLDANGKIVGKPLVEGLTMPTGFAYAPEEWGPYAGQLFIAEAYDWHNPTPRNIGIPGDGAIYRIDEEGNKILVAKGIRNPVGIVFHKNMAFVSDVGGDYISGRPLADGAVFRLTYEGE